MLQRSLLRAARAVPRTSTLQQAQKRAYSQAPEPVVKNASSARRYLGYAFFASASSLAGAALMWQVMTANNMGFLSDADSLKAFTPAQADAEAKMVEDTINNHPVVKALRADPTMSESRPHMKLPEGYRARSLTGAALQGPKKMVVPPYQWLAPEGKSMTAITYIGDDLCGHPGIVHGGLLATMLDEGLARCCFDALPHKIGVTANLNIDYRKPTPAGSFLVLKAETTKVEGRKAWVKGHIELLTAPGEKPTILAEATALYISPKYASELQNVDNDVRTKFNQWNSVKTNLATLQRKQTGNLATKSLTSIVDPGILVQDSEYLETHLIVVPNNAKKDFLKSYESLATYVVPRSAIEAAKDEEFVLFAVTTFKKYSQDFLSKCRENKWTPRQYKYVEGGKEEEQRELDKVTNEERKVCGEALRLGRTGWSEAVMIWMHVLTLRVFVEAVLRYGLPLDYKTAMIKTTTKLSDKVKATLDEQFGHLGGNAFGRDKNGRVTKDDAAMSTEMAAAGMGSEGNEYTAYVYYEIELP